MTSYFPDQGLIKLLDLITVNDLKIHAFTNNITPSDSTVLSGLTEAAWTGYAAVTLTNANWVSLGVTSHIGTKVYPTVTFSNTSGSPVTTYGGYITDNAGTVLIAVWLWDSSPVTIAATTGTYSFIPTIGDLSQN